MIKTKTMFRNCLLLVSMLLFVSQAAKAQCKAPANQPSDLKLTQLESAAIKIDFKAADNSSGASPANAYLVLRFETKDASTTPAEPKPTNGQRYSPVSKINNASFVYFGSDQTFTDTGVEGEKMYYYFVYAADDKGDTKICYNTNKPLSANITTTKTPSTTQDASKKGEGSSSLLAPLLNFNFVGKQNGWSNLTPVVFYGWSITGNVKGKKAKSGTGTTEKVRLFGNTFQVGPYIGSTIAIKDSTSYLPAIMLPGNAGLELNYFMTFFNEEKLSLVVCPLNFGLKVVSGFKDSNLSVVQHNIRHSIGINWANSFSLSVQYTKGWHNSTSNSEESYGKIFPEASATARYWNVSINTRLANDLFGNNNKSPLVLTLNWRSMVAPSDFKGLPNSRFITVGLISTVDLKSGTNPGQLPRIPKL
jgi:hypothetical protein